MPLTDGIFINVENMPIDFVVVRASEVPMQISATQSLLKVGITGSDIIWENGMGKDAGEELPLYELNPNAKRAVLYIGMKRDSANTIRWIQGREPRVRDLTGSVVATKYPRIAEYILTEKGMREGTILQVSGKDEAMPYVFENCRGVVCIFGTGQTAAMNDIEVLDIFYQVSLRMLKVTEKFNSRDFDIVDDFREKVAVARERRRMV